MLLRPCFRPALKLPLLPLPLPLLLQKYRLYLKKLGGHTEKDKVGAGV